MDDLLSLIKKTRTVRRFREEQRISPSMLEDLLEAARLGGSARNSQPLRYLPVTDKGLKEQLFPLLGWAGFLSNWPGPAPGERPGAYIICLRDRQASRLPDNEVYCDLGIASQNLLLRATEMGLAGCRIGSFSRTKLSTIFSLPPRYAPLLVIALGLPAEQVVLETAAPDDDLRYRRDDQGIHHVPKLPLEQIIYRESLGD